ncbi:nucleolar MIF4G domain-containing protein 1 homolog [Agrilus planipennis]|uniref:Nucleolar MIF4G domain-containing protein 1 homolog n=1 Tax=Agrilus planipennis TaxID=224129 RepID=A0A7F5R1Y0_AGRPL|nr:nucleolar MIF4G domain-containing protein 1 homolog [Agrilus planipennis]
MHKIAVKIEQLYMANSRNDMNHTLTNLIFEALLSPVLTPERFVIEHIMLITILHANIGVEVGAHFLQCLVKKFDEVYDADEPADNKILENIVQTLSHLYNFRVFDANLLYEILEKLNTRFTERDIECILLALKSVGFSLRKDSPLNLKNLIVNIQKQAANNSEMSKDDPRVKFMLDILMAIKNNNMTKIPNYDPTYAEHLKKLLKNFVRKGLYVFSLNISLEDLLKADERGKWWIVGSAWTGKETGSVANNQQKVQTNLFSQKLLDLARKQRMNTDTRRNIFCILMSAEDYLDAFEKLLHLGLKNQQEREIIHVIVHCCLQEKSFNPYYAHLAQKFCDYDRRFQMIIKYSVWDKLKALSECSGAQLSNMAKLLMHLFLEKGLPISTLKIMQFSELDKITLRFVRQILLGILLCEDLEQCLQVFEKVSQGEKLKLFRESIRLFIKHFLLRNLKVNNVSDDQKNLLEERANLIDKMLSQHDRKIRF